ncbi:glycosyltransferase family 4 protein [Paenibacillus gansuensis]|uniref:Glycosyltransferase family 4 protein n=1 Tax=Paenibacillus gansuensis TaxID=306542 RepID=A0ABW5PLC1_9BACL
MKVLHLSFGGQLVEISNALKRIGIDSTSCHFREKKKQRKPDICLHLDKYSPEEGEKIRSAFFEEALKTYDVFHFHFGKTFFSDNRDLAILKELGKKVIMQHRGSDVRMLSIAKKSNNPYVRIKRGRSRREASILTKLQLLSSYIHHAVVADYELYPYVSDHYKHVHVIRQFIDSSRFQPVYPEISKRKPFIVHAPTNLEVKGTDYVMEAIERLRRQGHAFDFMLIEDMPYEEALKFYKKADILIDQLLIGSFGILSLEGMALGKPVLCYIRDDLLDKYPAHLPIVNANPETVFKKLKYLLNNPQIRFQLGVRGREYVVKQYNHIRVALQLAEIYKGI